MSSHREQTLIDSPLEVTWDLVAKPSRYPSWWPRIIEVDGQRFEEGDEFVQVIKDPSGTRRSNFLIERRDELRQLRMSCQLTGMYADWTLTAAQDGTFVELELGMEPRSMRLRAFDAALGRRYFRKWSEESIAALHEVARNRTT